MSERKLGDLVKIKTGKLDANASNPNGIYPFFTCAEKPLKIDSFSYDCECVLVAGNGDLNVKYYSGKFDAYQRTYIIQSLDTDILDNRYLYLFLDSYLEQLRHQAIGGVIKYIKLNYLQDAKISLRTRREQEKIIQTLGQVKILIEKRRQSLAKLDQLAQSIFLDMFGDPVTNPKNWSIQKLSDYEEFLTSGSRGWAEYYSDSGALFIRIQNVKGTQLHLSDVAYVAPPDSAESRRTKVRPRDLLISITADLGRTCVIPNDIGDAYINQHLALMRLKGVNPFYIANFIESYAGKSQLMRMNREGVKAALNFSDIRSLEIPVPPINKQNDFERVVGQVFVLKKSYLKSLGQLQNLQQSLSQKFFGD